MPRERQRPFRAFVFGAGSSAVVSWISPYSHSARPSARLLSRMRLCARIRLAFLAWPEECAPRFRYSANILRVLAPVPSSPSCRWPRTSMALSLPAHGHVSTDVGFCIVMSEFGGA